MFANNEMLSAQIPTPYGDIDWSLLSLLARTDAALTWTGLKALGVLRADLAINVEVEQF